MDFEIDLNDQTNQQQDIDPYNADTEKPPVPVALPERAIRYNYALGTDSPGPDVLMDTIQRGYEGVMRDYHTDREIRKAEQQRQTDIQSHVANAEGNGRALDENDFLTIATMGNPEIPYLTINPQTFFEKKYADRAYQEATQAASSRALEMGSVTASDDYEDKAAAKGFIATQAVLDKLYEDTETLYGQADATTKVGNFVRSAVPFHDWWATYNLIKKNDSVIPDLMGNSMEEQGDFIRSLPPDEALTLATHARDYLMNDLKDPQLAMAFVGYLRGMSSVDKMWNNFQSIADLTTIPAVRMSTAIAKGAGRYGATTSALMDTIGETGRAAFLETQRRIATRSSEVGARVGSIEEVQNELFSLHNTGRIFSDAATTPLSVEKAQSMETDLTQQAITLLQASRVDPLQIQRIGIDSAAYDALMVQEEKLAHLKFREVSDQILGIEYLPEVGKETNTFHVGINFGKTSKDLFDTEESAKFMMDRLGIIGGEVKGRGGKFYIQVQKAANELDPTVRNALALDMAADPTPVSIIGKFGQWWRAADSYNPKSLNEARKVVVNGVAQLSDIQAEIMSNAFGKLKGWKNRQSRRDMITFLEHERDFPVPSVDADGVPSRGRFSNTIGEFYKNWRDKFGRDPTDTQAFVYQTYRQFNDSHYYDLNSYIYRSKSRWGAEMFSFAKNGLEQANLPNIEGRLLEKLPNDLDDAATIMIWNPTSKGTHEFYRSNFTNAAERLDFELTVSKDGYRVIQLSEDGDRALRNSPLYGFETDKGIPGSRINYVLVKDFKSSPLSYNQVPYRPGGHVEYKNAYFIAQADLRTNSGPGGVKYTDYMGDLNILNARTEKEANVQAAAMDHARILRKEGKNDELREYLQNGPLKGALSFQDFTKMFDKDRGGILSLDNPIKARTQGKSIAEQHRIDLDPQYINWRNQKTSRHDMYADDLDLKYTMERNDTLSTIVNVGTESTPVMHMRPASLVDPVTSMQRAARTAIRGRYIEDLKIKAAERFIKEFGDLLSTDKKDIEMFPWRTLLKGEFTEGHPDIARVAAAKELRRTTLELTTVKADDVAWVNSIKNDLRESLDMQVGTKLSDKISDSSFVEDHLLPTINDPSRFFRNVTFHTRMGLGNIKQWFLQGQGVTQTAAITGSMDRTLKGYGAGFIQRGLHLRANDDILEEAAKRAEKIGWKAEHFKESYQAFMRTGFQRISNAYGFMDDIINPSVVKTKWNKVTDVGLMPMKGGEKLNRYTAWNTAYLEWREANPLAKLTDADVGRILNRADAFTGNMTKASNAGFNKGFYAVPAQFISYQARLMDLMMGKTLTRAEKARLIGVNSVLYGVPTGVGGTTLGLFWNFDESAKKLALEEGIPVNDVGWKTFLDGTVQTGLSYILSEVTGEKVDPDLSSFGPSGVSLVYDFFGYGLNPKAPYEFFGGPALKSMVDLKKAGYAIPHAWNSIVSTFSEDNGGVKLSTEDFLPIINSISSTSSAYRAWVGYSTGMFVTKSGLTLGNKMSTADAAMMALLGAQPQEVTDYYQKKEIINARAEVQRDFGYKIKDDIKRAFQPDISTDDQENIMRRINAYFNAGGFNYDERARVWSDAWKPEYKSAMQKIDEKYRNMTNTQEDKYLSQFGTPNE